LCAPFVIPAKAGIQSFPTFLDSRLRGNDIKKADILFFACYNNTIPHYAGIVLRKENVMTGKNEIYQFKVTLKDSSPTIWRRFQVVGNISLCKMHEIIQIVMGWTDSHLHQFIDKGIFYGNSEDDDFRGTEILDEKKFKINQILTEQKQKIVYEYDFGDSWEHELVLEKIISKDKKINTPICIEGERACPPEDCGGIGGYEDLLETLKKPDDPEYENLIEWLDEDFDPNIFNLNEINRKLKRIKNT